MAKRETGWKKQPGFAPCVRILMSRAGMTVNELAVLVNASPGYLYRVLRGLQEPSWSLGVAIVQALGYDLGSFQDMVDSPI